MLWSEPQIWKEGLAEGLHGLSENKASGPWCMKAFLTLWLSMGFRRCQRWSAESKPSRSAVFIDFSSVLWWGGNSRNQEGGTAMSFLEQPFQLSLHPSSSVMGEHGDHGRHDLGCWDGARGSSGAAVPGEQAEWMCLEGWTIQSWEVLFWRRAWLHLLH